MAIGCNSSADEPENGADFGSSATSSEPEAGDVSDGSSPDSTAAADDAGSEPEESQDADGGEAEPVAVGFAAPVRFENGEHEADSIDRELVEEKLAEASLAAFDNWRVCIGIGKDCNFQRDVAPLLSATQRVFKGQDLDAYQEGERVEPGPSDSVAVVGVEALKLEPPILGQASLCVIDSGVQMIEAGPDREEEIIDDSAIAYVVVYQLASDADGVVTVEGEWYPEPFTEDLTLCDGLS